MTFKEFFKPTRAKIVISFIIFLVSFAGMLSYTVGCYFVGSCEVSVVTKIMQFIAIPSLWIAVIPLLLFDLIKTIVPVGDIAVEIISIIVSNLIYAYTLRALLVFLYQWFRSSFKPSS